MNRHRSLAFLLLVLAGMPLLAHACQIPAVAGFRELLPKARSVAIIRIESISLLPQANEDIVMAPEQVARVRVAEVVSGTKPKTELMRFSGNWCGGHNLKVGEYYVLLVERDSRIIDLELGSQSIVYLFGQYREKDGHRNGDSNLLMHLRNFATTGYFPDNFPVEEMLEHNYVPRDVAPRSWR